MDSTKSESEDKAAVKRGGTSLWHPKKLLHRTFVNAIYWPYMMVELSARAPIWRSTMTGKILYVDIATNSAQVVNVAEQPQPENTVRVVCLSDTHEAHEYVDIPDGDLLLHCGDICFQDRGETGSLARLKIFNTFLGTLPHKRKLVIAGNHDQILQDLGSEGAQQILTNATYLENSGVTLEDLGGLRVFGSPCSLRGSSGNRAFQYSGRSQELKEICDGIPENLDLLMTHGSGDLLSHAINEKRPKVHVSGHLHFHHGATFRDHTTFINAAILDNKYLPTHVPVVFDYPRRER